MTFSVTILGSNSATPTSSRNPSAQVVNHNQKLFLIDCGEGTQMQLRRYKIRFQKISHILISHLHGDHFFGLVGLISTFHLLGRQNELHIYGPSHLKEIIDIQLKASQTYLGYSLIFHELKDNETDLIFENNQISVTSFPMEHRIPTFGFLFKEKEKDRKIDKKFLLKETLPVEAFKDIKSGNDYVSDEGKVYKNHEITLDPIPERSYTFCSDTRYTESFIPLIKGTDLIYHEATFIADDAQNARQKYHSTTVEAASIAKKAEAKRLIIGHFSARYKNLQPLLEESQTVFQNTELAEEGKTFFIGDQQS